MKFFTFIALFTSLLGALFTSSSQAEWFSDTQNIMGTEVRVTLWHDQPEQGREAVAEVMAEMHRIDRQYNPWDENSELYKVNQQAATAPVTISSELVELLDKALYFGQLTHGAFDITFASAGHQYDYRASKAPSQQKLSEALINYRKVELDRSQLTVKYNHPAIKVDLGGIAKGYAVDQAIAILQRLQVRSASVSAGGDSKVLGDRRGRPWLVGIKNPRGAGDVAIKLPLVNEALSTSGDYERFFINEQGERVHHILNPSTGRSVNGIASVSVLGPNGFDTDPLSTSLFVLGVEKGMALIDTLPEYEAIIIDAKGKVHYSGGLVTPE